MIRNKRPVRWAVFAPICACACLHLGCDSKSSPGSTESQGLVAKPAPVDPKAFTSAQFDRIRGGLAGINAGRMLIQRTHPTGKYISSDPPTMILSADRREIIGKVTVRWAGGITAAEYETDFTIEITKGRVRLMVERDTAVFQIEPNQLRLAEQDLANVVRPLE